MLLRAKDGGRAKLTVLGAGPNLSAPAPVSPDALFDQNPSVLVQLVAGNGECWQAEYVPDPIRNRADLFKDKCGTRAQNVCP
jgi:hypothetical protein